jgi:hypothetical protein
MHADGTESSERLVIGDGAGLDSLRLDSILASLFSQPLLTGQHGGWLTTFSSCLYW